MTQVNLLPPEVRERQRTRQLTVAILFGAAAVVALLLILFVLQSSKLSSANKELTAQQDVNRTLQGRIASLAQFQQLRQQVNDQQALLTGLLEGQVLWSGVLQDVSMVIPSSAYLTQLSGNLNPAPATAGLIGSLQFNGVSLDQPTVADWLTRLEEVKGWVNSWVSSDTKGTDASGNPVINFTGTVDLTTEATTPPRPQR
jgi:Tfp pilus assembly protein PilN